LLLDVTSRYATLPASSPFRRPTTQVSFYNLGQAEIRCFGWNWPFNKITTNGSYAQKATFANSGLPYAHTGENGPNVCSGCCSQMISGMFSEVAHMYPTC